jgi:hypothetical protein
MWNKLQKKALQNFDVEKLRLKYAETDARQRPWNKQLYNSRC